MKAVFKLFKIYNAYRKLIENLIIDGILLKGSFIARTSFAISLAFLFFVDNKTVLMIVTAALFMVATGVNLETMRQHKIVYILIAFCFSMIVLLESIAYFMPEYGEIAKISAGSILLAWKFAVLFTSAAIFELLVPAVDLRYLFIKWPRPRLAVVSAAASIHIGKKSVRRARRALLTKGIRFRSGPVFYSEQYLGIIVQSWNDFRESFRLSIQTKGVGERNFAPLGECTNLGLADIPLAVMFFLCVFLAIFL